MQHAASCSCACVAVTLTLVSVLSLFFALQLSVISQFHCPCWSSVNVLVFEALLPLQSSTAIDLAIPFSWPMRQIKPTRWCSNYLLLFDQSKQPFRSLSKLCTVEEFWFSIMIENPHPLHTLHMAYFLLVIAEVTSMYASAMTVLAIVDLEVWLVVPREIGPMIGVMADFRMTKD